MASSPKEYGFWLCDVCDSHIELEEELATCSQPGCKHAQLCIGCTFECGPCGATFCSDHIIETPVGERTAAYSCAACDALRGERMAA